MQHLTGLRGTKEGRGDRTPLGCHKGDEGYVTGIEMVALQVTVFPSLMPFFYFLMFPEFNKKPFF